MTIDLTQMKTGESGVIKEIQGGFGMTRRVQSIGIRPGKKVTKLSSHFWRGPQTIDVDGSLRVAIGFGMSKKIMVEVNRNADK